MISPVLPAHDATTVVLDFGVFIAEQARTHRVSQTAIIAALRPCITPSQPEAPSKPHAPAAQTGEGAVSPPSAPSPVEPDQPETVNEAGSGLVTLPGLAADHGEVGTGDGAPQQNPGGENVDAPDVPATENGMDAADGGRADAIGSAVGTGALTDKPVEPLGSAAPLTKTERVRLCHIEHPDWPASKIAAETGIHKGSIHGLAKNAGVTLPKEAERERAQKAKTTEALKALPAKPQEALEPPPAPEAQTEPAQPPATTPSLPLPPPAIKVMHSTSGRFYLVERGDVTATRRYVHQSLAPDPSGSGPMMTTDRRWAWFNDMAKFRGAKKQWPQLANMRKEAAAK